MITQINKIVNSMDAGKALAKAGLLPSECKRIVIDISVGEPIKVFYECNGDEAVLDVVLDVLKGEGQGQADIQANRIWSPLPALPDMVQLSEEEVNASPA